jgi:hypothetical protein
MKSPLFRWLTLATLSDSLNLLAARWPDLDRAEFTSTTPQVDPDADAEIILREVIIDDSTLDDVLMQHYLRR